MEINVKNIRNKKPEEKQYSYQRTGYKRGRSDTECEQLKQVVKNFCTKELKVKCEFEYVERIGDKKKMYIAKVEN